jgi:hypothetical protein
MQVGSDVSSYLPLLAAADDIHRSRPATPPPAGILITGAALLLGSPQTKDQSFEETCK